MENPEYLERGETGSKLMKEAVSGTQKAVRVENRFPLTQNVVELIQVVLARKNGPV